MNIDEIYDFLCESQAVEKGQLTPEVDLCNDLGIEGDDFFELEEEFSTKFNVNMDSYLWYFHHGEEGWSLGSIFFPAPYQQVGHIPVTPKILLDAVSTKTWPIIYPKHELTDRKNEFLVNQLVLVALITFIIVIIVNKIS